jgi:site-specific DNA recombinase
MTIQGHLTKAERAWQGGQLPLGYRLDTIGGNGTGKQSQQSVLKVDEEQAKTVRKIFDMQAAGSSIWGISRDLNAAGMRTPKGKHWRSDRIKAILTSTTYKGTLYYNKVAHGADPATGKRKKVKRPKSEWISCDVTPIVDEKVWKQAQIELENGTNFQGIHKPKSDYLLSKLLYCAECRNAGYGVGGVGRMLHGQKTKNGDGKYRCYGRRETFGRDCQAPIHNISAINKKVCNEVYRLLMKPDQILDIWHQQFEPGKAEEYQEELDHLARQQRKLEGQTERADGAYVEGRMKQKSYEKQISRIEKEQALLEQEITLKEAKLGDARRQIN